jgi:hypothetical protein
MQDVDSNLTTTGEVRKATISKVYSRVKKLDGGNKEVMVKIFKRLRLKQQVLFLGGCHVGQCTKESADNSPS